MTVSNVIIFVVINHKAHYDKSYQFIFLEVKNFVLLYLYKKYNINSNKNTDITIYRTFINI